MGLPSSHSRLRHTLHPPTHRKFILAFVTLFILQLTANSFSSAWPFFHTSQQSQSGNPATGPPICSGFFQKTPPRKFVKSMMEFRGVGDEKTLNTQASRKAAQYLKRFQNRGGSQLNAPKGTWVTGSFNLTSNFTLFLEEGALILGSQFQDHLKRSIVENEQGMAVTVLGPDFFRHRCGGMIIRICDMGLRG
ncbi:hypothetical protein Ancab_026824 [Ancistrocladus abbreviatus]